jgi:hypothetical protein
MILLVALDFGRVFMGWVSLNNMARIGQTRPRSIRRPGRGPATLRSRRSISSGWRPTRGD